MSASPFEHGRDHRAELGRVVLAVAVDADDELVAVLPAYRKPVCTAPPMPRLNGSRTTCAPCAARDLGRAVDASRRRRRRRRGRGRTRAARRSRRRCSAPRCTPARSRSSGGLRAQPTRASSRMPDRARAAAARGGGRCARRAHARARAAPSPRPGPDRRAGRGIAATASSASLTTSSSLPGSNQRSIPLYGFETIAAPARRELERAARRRRVDGRVRAARDAEVDACGRDRAREDVERDVADQRARCRCRRWKSRPPSAKSTSGSARDGSPTIASIQSRRNLSP